MVSDDEDDCFSQPENFFHSIHSDNSIMKHIEGLDVQHPSPMKLSSQTDFATKISKEGNDKDVVSSSLKRPRTRGFVLLSPPML